MTPVALARGPCATPCEGSRPHAGTGRIRGLRHAAPDLDAVATELEAALGAANPME